MCLYGYSQYFYQSYIMVKVKTQKIKLKRIEKIKKYFYNKNLYLYKQPEFQSHHLTISGLNYKTAKWLVNLISISLGVVIFALIPYVANKIADPITSALLNVVPNGMILGFFIIDSKFIPYFTGLIFAPIINPFLNYLSYFLYSKMKFSAIWSLNIGIIIWALMVIIAYINKW